MSRLLKALGGFGILGLVLALVPGAAHAATITFNFNVCGSSTNTGVGNADCGTTSTYTSGGYTIVATAFPSVAGGGNDLWAKNGGAGSDENGLGLTSDGSGEDEITPGHFIQLTLSPSIVGNDPLTLTMGSTTGTEAWRVVETNTAGSMVGATFEMSGSSEGTPGFTISPTDTYLDITETTEGGNILLSSLSFTTATTPEPSSLVLLGSGILSPAGAVRRKLKA